MEDIIQKYKKEKKIKNISIVITSLALALGLNILLSGTESGKYLKANVMNTQVGTVAKSDLYIENTKSSGNILMNLKSSKERTCLTWCGVISGNALTFSNTVIKWPPLIILYKEFIL